MHLRCSGASGFASGSPAMVLARESGPSASPRPGEHSHCGAASTFLRPTMSDNRGQLGRTFNRFVLSQVRRYRSIRARALSPTARASKSRSAFLSGPPGSRVIFWVPWRHHLGRCLRITGGHSSFCVAVEYQRSSSTGVPFRVALTRLLWRTAPFAAVWQVSSYSSPSFASANRCIGGWEQRDLHVSRDREQWGFHLSQAF
ncbi:hypothetical protein LXA43DRAFT_174248 [Ganoderma leucocontextum]|nr:hypothetical protein LXA43DRAFT_174248 [Ganoderma leucocontextum]